MIKPLALLESSLEQMQLPAEPTLLSKFEQYMDMVLLKNQQMNLTAITDPEEFVIKHLIDSLTICLNPAMERAEKVIDVGTGGGFPGIPLALIYPEKQFLLMDSLNKRIRFLQEAAEKLNLPNVTALHGRAEDLGSDRTHREAYDMCVSRAVAKLSVLSEYCLPFVKLEGTFAAYKTLGEDLSLGENALKQLGGRIEEVVPFPTFADPLGHITLEHCIVYIKKIEQTPKQYPRKAGMPTKSPL